MLYLHVSPQAMSIYTHKHHGGWENCSTWIFFTRLSRMPKRFFILFANQQMLVRVIAWHVCDRENLPFWDRMNESVECSRAFCTNRHIVQKICDILHLHSWFVISDTKTCLHA